MALQFLDGFDVYAAGQMNAKYTSISGANVNIGSPGRLGYGQYLIVGDSSAVTKGLPGGPLSTIIVGFAWFYASTSIVANSRIFSFYDNLGNELCSLNVTLSGQLGLDNTGGASFYSSSGLVSANAWAYVEAQITFSNSTTGSVTIRFNGVTVVSQASVRTAANANGCSMVGFRGDVLSLAHNFFDDFYVLNTTAPNNTLLGDVKVVPLMPIGNGRVNGFTRFGGTSSGNFTAVNEIPPDGDTSYVYTATPGTEDCYTIATLSNVSTVLAVQVSAYARKDDTPSRVLSVGVGNGSTESFDAGSGLNTSYTYVLRQLDRNPLTSAAWAVADFATLQSCVKLIS